MQELEIKLDNLDARDMRQLNEVYAEVKRVNSKELHFVGCEDHTSVCVPCSCPAADPWLPQV